MSYWGGLIIADRERAEKEKILSRGINAVEKGKYLAIFTGGGFRLYDKTDYSLLIKETGMNYVYDGEFSNDMTMFAMKSWLGYVIFYNLVTGEKAKKVSLLDKKKNFDTSAGCGCTFGASAKDFYDIVRSDNLFVSAVYRYNTETLQREEVYFSDKAFQLKDIGYSPKRDKFYILGYERLGYRVVKGEGRFRDNSEEFILWTKDFVDYERFPLENGHFAVSLEYDDRDDTFCVYKHEGYFYYDAKGNLLTK